MLPRKTGKRSLAQENPGNLPALLGGAAASCLAGGWADKSAVRILCLLVVAAGMLWPVSALAQDAPAPPTSGMRLWLRADGGLGVGSVAGWPDQSGNNNAAVQSDSSKQPTLVANALNGRPVVRFNGGQWLNLPDLMPAATATAGEGFVVVKTANTTDWVGLWNFGQWG